jgi:hypothetical protein
MAQVDDFLKPESMMTPGVAGAITMTVSNTMWMQFGLQQRWCALVLSFAFGALVFAATRIPLWQRAVYYVLNSLIIFSAAAGGNYIGYQALESKQSASISDPAAAHAMSRPVLTQAAYAAEPASPMLLVQDRTSRGGASKPAATREEIERLKQEAQKKDEELKRLREELANTQAAAEGAKKEKPQPEEGSAGPEQRQRPFFTPKGF